MTLVTHTPTNDTGQSYRPMTWSHIHKPMTWFTHTQTNDMVHTNTNQWKCTHYHKSAIWLLSTPLIMAHPFMIMAHPFIIIAHPFIIMTHPFSEKIHVPFYFQCPQYYDSPTFLRFSQF